MIEELTHRAPSPARGSYEPGFEPVARRFAEQLRSGVEIGAALSVHHRGRHVVDLHGGFADAASRRPWQRDTRIVLFSVTKGFAAMAFNVLADRGQLEWDAPVADYWPEFGVRGKEGITLRTLLNHEGGLPYLDTPLTLAECADPERQDVVRRALVEQPPVWTPGSRQGYHAITFGMYAREIFERVAGESMGTFLRREIFEPLGSDVHLGTPASEDGRMATLYAPSVPGRIGRLVGGAILDPGSTEVHAAKAALRRGSISRRALTNPRVGKAGIAEYNAPHVRRAELAWASATASADGVARAYLPFATGGEHDSRRYLSEEALRPIYARQGWSERDAVIQKALGWSQGFLKEERHIFSPNPQSFGHAGMGGALGWCDPVDQVAFGYVMNKLDWRVRSPRAVGLCRALYECEPLR